MADRVGDAALGGHHVAAGEEARPARHHALVHLHGAVALHHHTLDAAEKAGIGILAQRQDEIVGLDVLKRASAARLAVGVERHHLDGELALVEPCDGPQPVDLHAFFQRLGGFEVVRGHVIAIPPVDDQGLVSQPERRARRVHRRVTASVDGHAPPQARRRAGLHVAEERHGVEHATGIPRGNARALRQVGTHCQEHRREGAVVPLPLEIRHAVIELEPDAHARDTSGLGVENGAGQPIGGNAKAHHATSLRARIAHDHVVPAPAQMIRGGEPARSGADHQYAPA